MKGVYIKNTHAYNFIDLTGQRFGKLTVIELAGIKHSGKSHYAVWTCKCDCGNTKDVLGYVLRYGTTKSCGCLKDKMTSERFGTHHLSSTRIYNIWLGMKKRCNNKKDISYKFYGAKGITYCKEWEQFENFYTDMAVGYKDNLTLDRINPKGGYCKENCRWLTLQEQEYNKVCTVYITYKGKKMNLSECSKLTGLKPRTLASRRKRGWSDKEIIETPYKKMIRRGR